MSRPHLQGDFNVGKQSKMFRGIEALFICNGTAHWLMRKVMILCVIALLSCPFADLLEGQTAGTNEEQTPPEGAVVSEPTPSPLPSPVVGAEGEVVSEPTPFALPSPAVGVEKEVISIGASGGRLFVTMGQSKLVTIQKGEIKRVSVTSPKIATVQAVSQREILLDGKTPGVTTMIIWDGKGKTYVYDVTVQRDVALLKERLLQIDKGISIEVDPAQDAVVLYGEVDSPAKITKAIVTAAAFFEDTELHVLAGPGGTIAAEDYRPKPLKFAGVGGGTAIGARGTLSFQEVSRVWNVGEGAIITTKNGRVISFLRLKEPLQVELQVRFVQVDLTLLKEYGFDTIFSVPVSGFSTNTAVVPLGIPITGEHLFDTPPAGTSPSGVIRHFLVHRTAQSLFMVQLRALEERQIIKTLSEPNLTVVSGQEATFLVGGEFPFIVPQRTISGTEPFFTVEWKVFGNKLELIPEVKETGMINLKLSPEVSERSPELGIDFPIAGGTVRIPGLTTRRTETSVEMESGESLVIAGLLTDKEKDVRTQTPLLGDIPILGTLFRKKRIQHERTELMIVVTPKLVRPMSPKGAEKVTQAGLSKWETVYKKFLETGRFEASKWLVGPFGYQ